jgi:hypothetical protein
LNNKQINSSNPSLSNLYDANANLYINDQSQRDRDEYNSRIRLEELQRQQQRDFEERKWYHRQPVDMNELIRLNVGGQKIVTRRRTLTKIPNSILAKMFDGSYQAIIGLDADSN